jgi:beta-lactam-binding protein with PASTA domain
VIEQKPTPWTLVPANTRVDVVVAVPALVAVPDLSEQVVKQAVTTLHGVGLELGGQQREESERSVGTVIDQTPSPGKRVERGTRVNVIVAAPRLIIVPDLTQLAVRQATATLDGVGLALGGERRQESERSAGTVIDQTPPPGKRVERGTRVEVVVAVAALVRVPDVTDQMVREAAETVQGARLVLGDQSRRPSRRPAGTVLEQRPSAGEMVARGATVHVVVAETPPAPPVASAPPAPTPPAPPRPLGPVGSDTTSPDPRPTPAPPTRPAPPASAVPDAPTPERLPTPAAPLSAPPPAAPATPVTPPAASAARPAPFPFWVASLAAFLLGAASMLTYRLVRKRMSRRSHSPVTPSVRFQLRQDAGTQEIAAGAVARRDRAVRLAVRLDPGQQTVWDQLVAEPRGERA